MTRKIHILCFSLSLCALASIGFDYSCGHMHENPLNPSDCPLCLSYHSTAIINYLLIVFIASRLLPFIGLLLETKPLSPLSVYLTTYTLRAPPYD